MPVTKSVRVAVEGQTIDGRTIKREEIEQMGRNYDRNKYGARIWLEHIRGILPDSQFRAYGDVLETHSAEVEIDGKKKLALFAKLDVTDEMVGINKARQKIYSSIEIQPNFAGTGEAYLAGLGVTDSPASLGTEALKLFSSRKLQPENLFSEAIEITMEIDAEPPKSDDGLGLKLLNRVKELLGVAQAGNQQDLKQFSEAITTVADSQKTLLEKFAALTGLSDKFTKIEADLKKVTDDFNALTTKLSKEPQPGTQQPRPTATGGDGQEKTDC